MKFQLNFSLMEITWTANASHRPKFLQKSLDLLLLTPTGLNPCKDRELSFLHPSLQPMVRFYFGLFYEMQSIVFIFECRYTERKVPG